MVKARTSRRVVSVRYRICLYADVDLDSGEVVQVIEDDESIRLDVGAVHSDASSDEITLAVVEEAYQPDGKPYRVTITPEIARHARAVAERAVWPEWEHP